MVCCFLFSWTDIKWNLFPPLNLWHSECHFIATSHPVFLVLVLNFTIIWPKGAVIRRFNNSSPLCTQTQWPSSLSAPVACFSPPQAMSKRLFMVPSWLISVCYILMVNMQHVSQSSFTQTEKKTCCALVMFLHIWHDKFYRCRILHLDDIDKNTGMTIVIRCKVGWYAPGHTLI